MPFDIPLEYLLLGLAALLAGLVDAVVGGGGLIQIPALLSAFPQTAIPTLFGTNKVSSIAGTGTSLWRYMRTVKMPWGVVLPASLAALPGAAAGAALVAWLPRESMKPAIVVMMAVVAVYTFWRKDMGQVSQHQPSRWDRWKGAALGGTIGLYDGFFGPGTGSFLIFGFVRGFGMDFVQASAGAKMVNFATNLSAIAMFASHGPILWPLGLSMAACNIVGAQIGTHLALKRGAGFVRQLFLVVVVVLLAKQAWDLLR
jgi:uncharacterized membrane protein YfcA